TLLEALADAGIRATQINSAGGFLGESNVTMMMGVEDHEVARVRSIIRDNCHPRTRFVNPLMPIAEVPQMPVTSQVEVLVGGATMFVVPILRYERLVSA
ncbi:MAG TPA: cyclic-di-AMP receptor, partial [Thermomicrobiales bacterium]|nr:cyclic-di-AMP receptor [Thermomicrobiales bacterium]